MTSPYITEAMRRRELPIKVRFDDSTYDDPVWEISAPLDYFPWLYLVEQYDVLSATAQYIHAINELSKEG